MSVKFEAKKLYYKIGEVCRIVGVPAHVLRYWESEFASLAPPKSRGGQRTYRPKDIELLLRIRELLYEDGFTIAGARRRLGVRRTKEAAPEEGAGPAPSGRPESPKPAKEKISRVRAELENILTLLDRG